MNKIMSMIPGMGELPKMMGSEDAEGDMQRRSASSTR